jgi:hypothetical protein
MYKVKTFAVRIRVGATVISWEMLKSLYKNKIPLCPTRTILPMQNDRKILYIYCLSC